MALTKTGTTLDEWAEVAQNGVREGAIADLTDSYNQTLYIACCLSSTTAHTGTEIIVQLSGATSGDEDWFTFQRFIGPTGTAISVALAGTEAAGQTELSVTNPATANLDNDGKYKFIENSAVANSEIIYTTTNSGDAGDTITILDGLTNEQTTNSNIFDIDSATASAVGQYVVPLPKDALRARVIYNNKYDPDGSTVHTYSKITEQTGI